MPSPIILAHTVAEILAFLRIDGHGYIDWLLSLKMFLIFSSGVH